MSNNSKTTETFYLSNAKVTMIVEWIDGKALDTEVRIEDVPLCFISGQQRAEFQSELKELINKFSI